MDKPTLEKMAVTAFANQTKAREELFTATEATITAKLELEAAKTQALVDGKIDGKNAEIREAQMNQYLQVGYIKLSDAEKLERLARRSFDLASIEVDTVKTLLRIAELP